MTYATSFCVHAVADAPQSFALRGRMTADSGNRQPFGEGRLKALLHEL